MRIFFSVGEPSGDLHGANLIRALREREPTCEAVGFGGPRMRAAGANLITDLTELAVMGVMQVLPQLGRYFHLLREADRQFQIARPDAVVLVDYPGFNWWVAARARRHRIPVYYFSPPQIWAWAQWRVAKMRRYVDHVFSGLEFEAEWLRHQGCSAQFVGHPYFDEIQQRSLDTKFVAAQRAKGPVVTLLPGSRTQEVQSNLPVFLQTAALVHRAAPDTHFAIAAFKESHAARARQLVAESRLPIEVHVGRTPELIEAATCCLACSGSVSLELLAHLRPTVIHYRVSSLWYWLQSRLRKTRYITLVNLLADSVPLVLRSTEAITVAASDSRVLFPEYLTTGDRSQDMARQLLVWLQDETARLDRIEELRGLLLQVGQPGATQRAAEHILAATPSTAQLISRPHFWAESLTRS